MITLSIVDRRMFLTKLNEHNISIIIKNNNCATLKFHRKKRIKDIAKNVLASCCIYNFNPYFEIYRIHNRYRIYLKFNLQFNNDIIATV